MENRLPLGSLFFEGLQLQNFEKEDKGQIFVVGF